jgi:hypothetical protein
MHYSNYLATVYDNLIWYSKDPKKLKYRQLFLPKERLKGINAYRYIESPDGTEFRTMTREELENPDAIPKGWRRFQSTSLISQGATSTPQEFAFGGTTWIPPAVNGLKKTHIFGEKCIWPPFVYVKSAPC